LLRAEDTRSVAGITDDDISSADVTVRRAVARALARAEAAQNRDHLLKLLSDGDPEVLSWAAYGLGRTCRQHRKGTTPALVARAVALQVEPPVPAGRLDTWFALARALGACGDGDAERTLTAWLAGAPQRGVAAALGLGDVASRAHRLQEETAAALLHAAAGDAENNPRPEAFHPFSRLARPPARVHQHLLTTSTSRLGHPDAARPLVVRALGTLGDAAVESLARVLEDAKLFQPAERAEAARALGKVSSDHSTAALLRALDKLAPASDPVALTALVGPGFGPLLTALQAVPPANKPAAAKGVLHRLASLPLPPKSPPPLRRRVVQLRCAAASRVAGSDAHDARLLACDPDQSGQAGALARLQVLDRGQLRGAAFKVWRSLLASAQPARVREAALDMIAAHREIDDVGSLVAQALRAEQSGVVATAANLIAGHPERFFEPSSPRNKSEAKRETEGAPQVAAASVVKALAAARARAWPDDAVETVGALARATGALRLRAGKVWLDKLCNDPNPTLRQQAQTALSSLGENKVKCDASPAKVYAPAEELGHLVQAPVKILLETDVGVMTLALDPALAPVAVTRAVDLVRAGFYDGNAVHRVVPGFVAQFGDPQGDGYGGAGKPALRCETSPVPFQTGVVGVALAGRDTGSSQLFVTLGPSPHLDGQYAVLGTAQGPWADIAEGDIINKARVAR
jgi:cyclophilin family peptidyl-prolyl cis-trans isomerase/HEAT repeat protein